MVLYKIRQLDAPVLKLLRPTISLNNNNIGLRGIKQTILLLYNELQ